LDRDGRVEEDEVRRGQTAVIHSQLLISLALPSFPILFFSQTADPVTPLISAKKMAEGFGSDSASLLVQNGYDARPSICPLKSLTVSVPSRCTLRHQDTATAPSRTPPSAARNELAPIFSTARSRTTGRPVTLTRASSSPIPIKRACFLRRTSSCHRRWRSCRGRWAASR
jgi:hypothetical protein